MTQHESIEKVFLELKRMSKKENRTLSKDEIYEKLVTCNYDGKNIKRFGKPVRKNKLKGLKEINGYSTDSYNLNFEDSLNNKLNDDANHSSWLRFAINYRKKIKTDPKLCRLYIPIDQQRNLDCYNDVLKYAVDNDIYCDGKVATGNRTDNFILDFEDTNQASKIMNYISNSNISKNLTPHNPFVPDYNGLGFVFKTTRLDNQGKDKSYTDIVSKYLSSYMNNCRKIDNMDFYNFDDFIESINNGIKTTQDKDKKSELTELSENFKLIEEKHKNRVSIENKQQER